MKPYGVPRQGQDYPDIGDIKSLAMKSSKGRLPGRSGDARSLFKDSGDKQQTRRLHKRKARAEGKQTIMEEMIE